MKKPSLEKIEEEEFGLKQAREDLANLKKKWIKTSGTLRMIEFLEHYCEGKEKFIKKLREFKTKR
jgi:hypothetical protein